MPFKTKIETMASKVKSKAKGKRKNTPRKYNFGRPTKYSDDFPQQLVEHMGKGFSFESFGGMIDVCKDTLYRWLQDFPEFSDAYKIGKQRCQTCWENLGAAGQHGLEKYPDGNGDIRELKVKTFSVGLWIYNMKVRFGRDWIEPDKAAMVEKVTRFLEAKEAQEALQTSDDSNEVTYVVEMTDTGKFKHSRPKLIKSGT